MSYETIKKQILKLSREKRAELAQWLNDSLDSETDFEKEHTVDVGKAWFDVNPNIKVVYRKIRNTHRKSLDKLSTS